MPLVLWCFQVVWRPCNRAHPGVPGHGHIRPSSGGHFHVPSHWGRRRRAPDWHVTPATRQQKGVSNLVQQERSHHFDVPNSLLAWGPLQAVVRLHHAKDIAKAGAAYQKLQDQRSAVQAPGPAARWGQAVHRHVHQTGAARSVSVPTARPARCACKPVCPSGSGMQRLARVCCQPHLSTPCVCVCACRPMHGTKAARGPGSASSHDTVASCLKPKCTSPAAPSICIMSAHQPILNSTDQPSPPSPTPKASATPLGACSQCRSCNQSPQGGSVGLQPSPAARWRAQLSQLSVAGA